jgi:hypothetical protein
LTVVSPLFSAVVGQAAGGSTGAELLGAGALVVVLPAGVVALTVGAGELLTTGAAVEVVALTAALGFAEGCTGTEGVVVGWVILGNEVGVELGRALALAVGVAGALALACGAAVALAKLVALGCKLGSGVPVSLLHAASKPRLAKAAFQRIHCRDII